MSNISSLPLRIKWDILCDFIPVVSTASNFIDLVQKHCYYKNHKLNRKDPITYSAYVVNKSSLMMVFMCIPVINTIVAAIFHFKKDNNFVTSINEDDESAISKNEIEKIQEHLEEIRNNSGSVNSILYGTIVESEVVFSDSDSESD